jgi:hypothetical protein
LYIFPLIQSTLLSFTQSWDINNAKASPGPFNIMVANNLSTTAKDLPAALASLYDNVLEGGFLMLEELTGAFFAYCNASVCSPALGTASEAQKC